MPDRVTIGVPVYRGERFLAETLRCIQVQTHRDFEVLMSVDGHDAECEAICNAFLEDQRFRLVVQPERLGWVGNINWLMGQATGDYWYYHQQDDLTAETYLAELLEHARDHPEAALVHCDLVPFGRITGSFPPAPSVLGATPYSRQMAMLHEQLPAFAFRGLTRVEAVRAAGGIVTNDCDNYGVDTTWLAAVALSGELHRVPGDLYRKRYHDQNTESKWWAWSRARRIEAWSCHCVNMLQQALRVPGSAHELRLLWLAAVARLSFYPTSRPFFPEGDFSPAERKAAFNSFLRRAQASRMHDIPALLDASWRQVRAWSADFYRASR